MFHFHIRVLAREDIQQIVEYYEEEAPNVTDRFLEILHAEFEVIRKNPIIFSKKYRSTHVHYLKNFPYGIHYILRDKTVEVLAVLHTSRNPEIWGKR